MKTTEENLPHLLTALQQNPFLTSVNLKDAAGDAMNLTTNILKICKMLAHSSLESLNLQNCISNDESLTLLSQSLANNTSLKFLDLTFLRIKKDLTNLCKALQENICLESLNLYGKYICDEDAQMLSQALTINSCLNTLNLELCNIGESGITAIAESLQKNRSLTSLNLATNNSSDEGGIALGKALLLNTTLEFLDLSNNYISDKGWNAIARALLENKKSALINLNISRNRIRQADILTYIGQALISNTTLASLNFGCNNLGGSENLGYIIAKTFSEVLTNNETLTSLNIGLNTINSEGIKLLSHALRKNTHIQILGLGRNKIYLDRVAANRNKLEFNISIMIEAIRDILKFNASIVELNLDGLPIEVKDMEFCMALKENKTLETLSLSATKLDPESGKALGEVLQVNKTLTDLSLSYNQIGDLGAIAIATALENNRVLTYVNLEDNNITQKGQNALIKALTLNRLCKVKDNSFHLMHRNSNLQARLKLNWMYLAPLIRFISHSANGQHPIQDSILSLLPTIVTMAKTDHEFHDDEMQQNDPIPMINLPLFMKTKFFANQQQEGFLDKSDSPKRKC